MARSDLTVALRLLADSHGLDAGLRTGERSVHRFTSAAKREFHELGAAWNSTMGRIGQIGLGLSAASLLRDSARLDKSLTQTRQTAGETKDAVAGLRGELFEMGRQTGANIEDLQSGAAALIASGTSWKATREDIQGINIAMAVTGANAKTLAGGLTVAGEAFQFDLEKPGLALQLLDKMTVAGRKGNAELENLADIFARVGVNAASAGLGFEKTLAFVETLSLVERQPERLATLADSTVRLFNNNKYMETAQEASGVKFFDQKGGRRDPIAVLKDLRKQYQLLKTDKSQTDFIANTFDKMDLDTVKGLRTLLSGDALDKITDFEKDIKGGVGTLAKDLPDALNNAIDQSGRLKNTLREAADGFAQPVNQAVANLIKYGLDEKKLTGGEIMAGGAATLVGGYAASRLLKGGVGELIGSVGGTAGGVVAGKALQEYAGVTPVFVVNMRVGGVGGAAGAVAERAAGSVLGSSAGAAAGAGGLWAASRGWGIGAELAKVAMFGRTSAAILGGASLSQLPAFGAGAVATGAAGVGLAGAAGYGAGHLVYSQIDDTKLADRIGYGVAKVLATFGNQEARQAIAINENKELQRRFAEMKPDLREAIDSSNLADRIGQKIDGLAAQINAKKADLTVRIVGQPAQVQSVSSTGFNVNVDSGILPVGH